MPTLLILWFPLSAALFLSIFRLLRFPWAHRGEEWFFAAVSALGWISAAAMLLGLAGEANTPAFCAAAAATGVPAVVLFLCSRRRAAPPPVPAPRIYLLCGLALLWFPFVFLPPFFYDTLHYHYGLPAVFLQSGSTRPLSWFVESHFPLGVEMLSLVGIAAAGYVGANLAGFMLFALPGVGILCLADRLGARRAGWIALLLYLFSSTSVRTLLLQKNDAGVALFFFAFVYAALLYRESGGDRRFLVLAGALAGASLGTKYTMLVFVAVASAAMFLPSWNRGGADAPPRAPSPARLADPFLFLAAAAFVYAPWPLRNVAASGNPVYPLLNGVFRSPTWSPARMALLAGNAHSFSAMFHGPLDAAKLLASVTFFPDPTISGGGASLGAAFVGTLLFPALRRRSSPPWLFLRNVALGCLAAWFFTSWFTRFLLPALPPMALLTGAVVSEWSQRVGKKAELAAAAIVIVCLAAQAASAVSASEYPPFAKAYRASVAVIGRPDRASRLASQLADSFRAARFVNARLPAGAKILFVGETRLFYFHRAVVAPSAFDEHPLRRIAVPGRPPGEIRRLLVERGFTHILVNRFEWDRFGRTYYRSFWPKEERMAVNRFLAGLPAVYRERAISVLSLGAASRP